MIIGRFLLHLFGINDDAQQPSAEIDIWECPTCGHQHSLGYLYLGKNIASDKWLRDQYENGQIETATYLKLMELQ